MGMPVGNPGMGRHVVAHPEQCAIGVARGVEEGDRLAGLRISQHAFAHPACKKGILQMTVFRSESVTKIRF
jgi:hypothetical protein